jgi:hypothetical protein
MPEDNQFSGTQAAGTDATEDINRSSMQPQTISLHGVTCQYIKFQSLEFQSVDFESIHIFWCERQCHSFSFTDVWINLPRSRTVSWTNNNSYSVRITQLCNTKAARSSETSAFTNLVTPTQIPLHPLSSR